MAIQFRPFILALVLAGCTSGGTRSQVEDRDLAAAEALVSAFYAFDAAGLRQRLAAAPASVPFLSYYQGWARGAHYRVVKRAACTHTGPGEIACAVTVEDDLIRALRLPGHVTDTFHVGVSAGRITSVRTSSDDPPLFHEALDWVKRERPDIVDGVCQGFFNGGPTPEACAEAVVGAFAEYAADGTRPDPSTPW